MAGPQPITPRSRAARRESQRSRKGCPECRSRKVKCDEQSPECGQCLKAGRVCRIIDSLFKRHSYSFPAQPSPKSAPDADPRDILPPEVGPITSPPRNLEVNRARSETPQQDQSASSPQRSNSEAPVSTGLASPNAQHVSPPSGASPVNNLLPETENAQTTSSNCTGAERRMHLGPENRLSNLTPRDSARTPEQKAQDSLHQTPTSLTQESYQDRCEIALFLRHFSEGPGRWMDVCSEQKPYFSQQVVLIAQWNPLVRYAACALAAKQLGHVKNPEAQIRQTNSQRLMMKALIDSDLGFTWYGAKYYEKAIQILAKQISHRDRATYSLSPNYIYDPDLTPCSGDLNIEHDDGAAPFQIIAASILCQYEDVSSTMRAWSGHLDGIYRLLRPHISDSVIFKVSTRIPQPMRVLDDAFWFFVVHDMLNAYVSRKRTRVDPDDLLLWCKMGLPLDERGRLVADYVHEAHSEVSLFKALVRMMCQLVSSDLGDAMQWSRLTEDFDRWENMVPSSFYMPVSWPPDGEPSHIIHNGDIFSREIWFASDLSAITTAFYHMARMILLIRRPMEIFLRQSHNKSDLLDTYNTLQEDLRRHAMEIIPIMHALPSDTVRKLMLQPLYVAGRCLTADTERKALLQMLRDIEDDVGLFTGYRIKGLSEEWGIRLDVVEK